MIKLLQKKGVTVEVMKLTQISFLTITDTYAKLKTIYSFYLKKEKKKSKYWNIYW